MDKAYVTSLHNTILAPVKQKGEFQLNFIFNDNVMIDNVKGVSRRQQQVNIHESYQFLLKLIEEISKLK